MPKSCIVTGKQVKSGFNVSHSNRRTKRKLYPNLHKRRLLNPATGTLETVWISTRGLRTLKKWLREGKTFDLKKLGKKS